MNGPDSYGYIKFMIQSGPHMWNAELRVWDAKNFGPASPGTHRNKFVKKSLLLVNKLLKLISKDKGN